MPTTICRCPWSTSGLDAKMTGAFHAVHKMAQERVFTTGWRSYLGPCSRVAEACKPGGWVATTVAATARYQARSMSGCTL